MKFPENVRYTADHEWIREEGDKAYVGITDYAQGQLGEIVFIDVSTEGETVAQGEVFGSIEAVKTVSDLLMPLPGTVLEVNSELEDHPEWINSDPYGAGWIICIEPAAAADWDTLMTAAEYQSHLGQ
jgi:glycine cleavage system H protein